MIPFISININTSLPIGPLLPISKAIKKLKVLCYTPHTRQFNDDPSRQTWVGWLPPPLSHSIHPKYKKLFNVKLANCNYLHKILTIK